MPLKYLMARAMVKYCPVSPMMWKWSADLKSELDIDHYFCNHPHRYCSDDVHHQLADDSGGFRHPPTVVWYPWLDYEQVAGLLQTPAGLPGSHQWSRRRNVWGHVVVKAFNGEAKSVEYFDTINDTLFDSAWKSEFLTGLLFPIMNFVGNLGYVAICVLGGYLVVKGTIPMEISRLLSNICARSPNPSRRSPRYPTSSRDNRCS